jgi:hypothetical protein
LFAAEQQDVVDGWSEMYAIFYPFNNNNSNNSNDVLCPITLGFALLENYLELRDHVIPMILYRMGWRSAKVTGMQTSLIIHHFLFLCAVSYTMYSKSVIYYSNMMNLWEGTAPISFMVWLAQARFKWQEKRVKAASSSAEVASLSEDSDAPVTNNNNNNAAADADDDDDEECVTIIDSSTPTTPRPDSPGSSSHISTAGTFVVEQEIDQPYLTSDKAVYRLMLIRIAVWILVRVVIDIVYIRSLWLNGLLPFGSQSRRLRFGNKIQLWLAASTFIFGLNPFWLHSFSRVKEES